MESIQYSSISMYSYRFVVIIRMEDCFLMSGMFIELLMKDCIEH